MSETQSGSERFRPLPLRRKFWREMLPRIKDGTVIIPEDQPAREDARNAAQAVIIGYIERELMSHFKRPEMNQERDFYAEFHDVYMESVTQQEFEIWEKIAQEMEEKTQEAPADPLSDKLAAYLTLAFLGNDEPPQSRELYGNLAFVVRAYESLLREKYGEKYSDDLLYAALEKHMKPFFLKFISMDAITSMLLSANATTKETRKSSIIIHADAVLDPRFMDLEEDDSLNFPPELVNAIHKHVQEKSITTDAMGRTEDRGCPVLYSSERDAVIDFAITELIAQHRLRFQQN